MKKTDVRAGSMLLFNHSDHVLNTRPYASILGTSSCCDQYLEFGLLQKFNILRTWFQCLIAERCREAMHFQSGMSWELIEQSRKEWVMMECTDLTFMSAVFIHQM